MNGGPEFIDPESSAMSPTVTARTNTRISTGSVICSDPPNQPENLQYLKALQEKIWKQSENDQELKRVQGIKPTPKTAGQNSSAAALRSQAFRLNHHYMTTIRYEVVYKNLIRSLRKFYTKDFKEQAQAASRRGSKT